MVWDVRTGEPYANAIVWQDTRTDKIAAELERDGHGELIRERAGIPPSTYFAGGKLAWLLRNVDGVREAAEAGHARFGTMDSWLLWHLTGGPDGGRHLTDVTNASRTMLMDLTTLDWDDRAAGAVRGPPVPAARDRAVQPRRGVRHHPVGRAVRRGAADRRGPGRPARGHGRPGLPRGRRGQEHLRHRQLPAAEHRHRDLPVGERAADHRVLPVRRRARDVRAGGFDRGHRLGDPVAARPARDHPRRRRDRGPGRARWTTWPGPTSCRRSPGCSPRTGARTPAARSSACPASTPGRTWPGRRWRRSATRAWTWCRRWRRTRASRWTCSRWTAGSPRTTCACRSRPTRWGSTSAGRSWRRPRRSGAAYAAGLARGVLGLAGRAAGQLARGPAVDPPDHRRAAG